MTLHPPKILVVDDNRADAAAMRKLLSQLRCQVIVAQSGNEALAACVHSDFALIFLSVEMPDMDGYEVAEFLMGEASTRHIPIIFVTASHNDEALRMRAYELGATDYIEKPVGDLLVLAKAAIFFDLYASKQQLKLELARSESMRAAARENEARYRDAIDSAPIPIMLHAEDGEVLLVNKTWLELTGYARDELATVDAWIARAFGTSGDAVRYHFGQLYDISGAVREGEYQVRTAKGSELVWDFRSSPLAVLQDGRRLVLSMAQDVTLHRASLRAAAEAKRMAESADRAKGEFLANMSHEIRTPLHVILGLGHLLQREVKDAVPKARLDQLCATSDHLLAIINDVLDLSKIQAQRLTLDLSEFRLDAVVEKVVRIVEGQAQGKGLTLTTDIAPRLQGISLNGDALRLAQVLINLCGNAVKFTDEGVVRLRIGCLAGDADGVTLCFIVEDSGIGIEAADRMRLFQAFEQADGSTTRERGGTGLGLAISQHLVLQMGGKIEVESELGVGSRFSFEITLPEVDIVPEAAARAVADLRGLRVLYAEDHPLSREIVMKMLEDIGCIVEVASNGSEAVECAQARSFDLILLDMQMPKKDGLAATRAIRMLPEHLHTPIIALTANAFADDRQRCLDAGMNGHIGKPVTPATLAASIGQWLPKVLTNAEVVPDTDEALSLILATTPGLDGNWRRSGMRIGDFRDMLGSFITMHGDDMSRLGAHLAADEQDEAHAIIHNLRGISSLIGAGRVAALATELGQHLRCGAKDSATAPLLEACAAELKKLAAAVLELPPASSSHKVASKGTR